MAGKRTVSSICSPANKSLLTVKEGALVGSVVVDLPWGKESADAGELVPWIPQTKGKSAKARGVVRRVKRSVDVPTMACWHPQ